uniref:Ixodegrin B n=1 Tax=Rhipicephalus zambeziensis TaxID=60191 RepID=A0A224YLM3_9ACAR
MYRYFNVVCTILLLSSCLSQAAGYNRNRMVLQGPHHKGVRSVGQDCNAKMQCILWTCCLRSLKTTACYQRARVGGRCSSYNISGIYNQHCPCAPGHGSCFMGRCVLRNNGRQHVRHRL